MPSRVRAAARRLAITVLGIAAIAFPPLIAWSLAIADEGVASPGVFAPFVVSLYTLEATIAVAFGVYHLQESHARRGSEARVAQAKEVLR